MGYPQLFSNNGNCVEWLGYGISDSEAAWMNQLAIDLSDVLCEVATAAHGNPETIHGIVAAKTAGEVHSKPQNPSQQSFHPKISGAANHARALNREFRNIGL